MSDSESTPDTQGLSVAEAVDLRLAAGHQATVEDTQPVLDEAPVEVEETSATDETTEEPETQEAEAPAEDEETEEEGQEVPVSEDEDSIEESAEVEEEEEPEEPVYTLEIDGERHEVTLDELKRGHLRQSDYTRKTQDLAEDRKGVTTQKAELSTALEATAVIMESALQASGDELAQFANTDWETLQKEDAYEFGTKYQAYQFALQKREGLEQQAGQLVTAQQQQQYESTQARLVQENQLLIQKIPDMADVTAGPVLMGKIKTYAVENLGLSGDEVDTIIDHRVIVALDKARKYDLLDGKVKAVGAKKKSKAPSRTVKAGAKAVKSSGQSEKVAKLRARARQTGSIEDAVAANLAASGHN